MTADSDRGRAQPRSLATAQDRLWQSYEPPDLWHALVPTPQRWRNWRRRVWMAAVAITVMLTWAVSLAATEQVSGNRQSSDMMLAESVGIVGLFAVLWLWAAALPVWIRWASAGVLAAASAALGVAGPGQNLDSWQFVYEWADSSPLVVGLLFLFAGVLSLVLWRPTRWELRPPLLLSADAGNGRRSAWVAMLVLTAAAVIHFAFPGWGLLLVVLLAVLGPVEGREHPISRVRNTRLKLLTMAVIMGGAAALLVGSGSMGCEGFSVNPEPGQGLYLIDQMYRGLSGITGADWVFDGCGVVVDPETGEILPVVPLAVRLGRLVGFAAIALAAVAGAWQLMSPVRTPLHLRLDRDIIAFVGVNPLSLPIINYHLDTSPGRVYVVESDPDAPGLAEVVARGARHVDGRVSHQEFFDRAIRQWPSRRSALAELYLLHEESSVNRRWHREAIRGLARLVEGAHDHDYSSTATSTTRGSGRVRSRPVPTRIYVRIDDVRGRVSKMRRIVRDPDQGLVGANWMVDLVNPMDTAARQLVGGASAYAGRAGDREPAVILTDDGQFSLAVLQQLLAWSGATQELERVAAEHARRPGDEPPDDAGENCVDWCTSIRNRVATTKRNWRRRWCTRICTRLKPRDESKQDGGSPGKSTDGDAEPAAGPNRTGAFMPRILLTRDARRLSDETVRQNAAGLGIELSSLNLSRAELPDHLATQGAPKTVFVVMAGSDDDTLRDAWAIQTPWTGEKPSDGSAGEVQVILLDPTASSRPNRVAAGIGAGELVIVHPTLASPADPYDAGLAEGGAAGPDPRARRSIRNDRYRIQGTWDAAAEFVDASYNIRHGPDPSRTLESGRLDDKGLGDNLRPLVSIVQAMLADGWSVELGSGPASQDDRPAWSVERVESGVSERVVCAEHANWMRYKVEIARNYGPEFPHCWAHVIAGREFKTGLLRLVGPDDSHELCGASSRVTVRTGRSGACAEVSRSNLGRTKETIRDALVSLGAFGLRAVPPQPGGIGGQSGGEKDDDD